MSFVRPASSIESRRSWSGRRSCTAAPHVDVDPTVPIGSRIIRAVNAAYDDLVGDNREQGRALEALERLRLGMAYEYDPVVVESLSRVVARSTPT